MKKKLTLIALCASLCSCVVYPNGSVAPVYAGTQYVQQPVTPLIIDPSPNFWGPNFAGGYWNVNNGWGWGGGGWGGGNTLNINSNNGGSWNRSGGNNWGRRGSYGNNWGRGGGGNNWGHGGGGGAGLGR